MSFKAALFDLDGTLLDTLEDLAVSANTVLAENGMPGHPVDKYRYFVGEGLQVLIERILPEEQRIEQIIKKLAGEFKEVYIQNWKAASGPYDGISDMLNQLETDGIRLAILSNKPHEFTRMCVAEFFPDNQFEPLFGARSGVPTKPDPAGAVEIAALLRLEPAEIAYLGDTATDMQTAVRAGMYPVGALWGFRAAAELEQSGAARLVNTPCDFLELF